MVSISWTSSSAAVTLRLPELPEAFRRAGLLAARGVTADRGWLVVEAARVVPADVHAGAGAHVLDVVERLDHPRVVLATLTPLFLASSIS